MFSKVEMSPSEPPMCISSLPWSELRMPIPTHGGPMVEKNAHMINRTTTRFKANKWSQMDEN
jgi:hypothetical protein